MQLSILECLEDSWRYQDKNVMIGLSGGINSAAVLVYLVNYVPKDEWPDVLHLYYAHFEEHSPDTMDFVLALVKYAKDHFKKVVFEMTENSVNRYFIDAGMIPHPTRSTCTGILKIFPMAEYMHDNKIDVDLVGYVREDKSRIKRQKKYIESKKKNRTGKGKAMKKKEHPIAHLSDEDCFSLVEKHLGPGVVPDIYKIKWNDKRIIPFLKCHKEFIPQDQYKVVMAYARAGYNIKKHSYRVFDHNNCLPCKNMQSWQLYMVKLFYPKKFERAIETAEQLGQFWGRNADEMSRAGQDASCSFCQMD